MFSELWGLRVEHSSLPSLRVQEVTDLLLLIGPISAVILSIL